MQKVENNIFQNLAKPVSEKTQETAALSFILFLAFILRLPFLNVPLDGDAGVFTAIARLLSKGFILYKDLFEIKPPGIFFLFSGLFKIVKPDLLSVNLFTAAWGLINTFLVYILAGYLFDKKIRFLAGLLFAVFSPSPFIFGTPPLSESFMITFIMAGAIIFLKASGKKCIWYFYAGILYGLAFMFKQVAIFEMFASGLFLFILSFLYGQKHPLRKFFLNLVSYIGGFVIVFIITVLYFISKGALSDFLFCVFTFNAKYITVGYSKMNPYWGTFLHQTLRVFKGTSLLWVCAVIFLATISRDISIRPNFLERSRKYLSEIFIALWMVFAFFGICLSGRFILHYYIALLAPFCIASAVVLVKMIKHYNRNIRIVTLICVASSFLFTIAVNYKYYFVYTPDETAVKMFNDSPFPEARDVGIYLNSRLNQNDYVFNWSKEPEIFFYAQVKPVSKYLWISPYTVYFYAVPDSVKEVAEALEKNIPKYIVVDARFGFYMFDPIFKPLRAFFIRHKYVIEKRFPLVRNGKIIGALDVSRLKEQD